MEEMRSSKSRKSTKKSAEKKWKVKELCSGPSKLCQALGITRDNTNEKDLSKKDSDIWLESAPSVAKENITISKRIGIEGSGAEYANLPYRFYEKHNDNVSVLDPQDKKSRKRKTEGPQ